MQASYAAVTKNPNSHGPNTTQGYFALTHISGGGGRLLSAGSPSRVVCRDPEDRYSITTHASSSPEAGKNLAHGWVSLGVRRPFHRAKAEAESMFQRTGRFQDRTSDDHKVSEDEDFPDIGICPVGWWEASTLPESGFGILPSPSSFHASCVALGKCPPLSELWFLWCQVGTMFGAS